MSVWKEEDRVSTDNRAIDAEVKKIQGYKDVDFTELDKTSKIEYLIEVVEAILLNTEGKNKEILAEVLKNRISSVNIANAISDKRTELINTFVRIEEYLLWIKKRIGKWFVYVLLLSNVLSFVLGGLANENKEVVYPILEKGYNIFSSLKKVKE